MHFWQGLTANDGAQLLILRLSHHVMSAALHTRDDNVFALARCISGLTNACSDAANSAANQGAGDARTDISIFNSSDQAGD